MKINILRSQLLAASAVLAFSGSPGYAEDAQVSNDALTKTETVDTVLVAQAETPSAAAQGDEAHSVVLAQNVTQHAVENVTVSARRREESAQEVPLPLAVIGAKEITSQGIQNVTQLLQVQPAINYYGTNPRNAALNIRGLGAPLGLTNDGLEQGVGLYVDQVYYSRIATALNDLFDVERVEVLRGPQGTLYGKNTTAGAINVITNAPSFSPIANFEASAGSLDYYQVKGAVSGPLTDNLAFRIAGSATKRQGTIHNLRYDKYLNDKDSVAGRASLLWRPMDTLNLTLTADLMESFPDSGAQVYVRTGATQRPLNRQFAALAAAFNYAPPSTNAFDRVTDLDTASKSGQRGGGVSLRAEWDLGPGTLTSISAWRFWNWYPSNDRDFTGLPITTVSGNPSKHRQWTQELRFTSTKGETFDYTIGGFFFDQKFHTTGAQEQGPAASRFLLNPGPVPPGSSACIPATANACNPSVLNGLRSDNDIRYKSRSIALYGQLTWNVSDDFRIQPGVRINRDEKEGSYEAVVRTASGSTTLNADQRGVLPPQAYAANLGQWDVAYDVTASYDFAPGIMGYATYAHSFKSAGINMNGLPLNNGQPVLSSATVKPEKLNNYETGLKTTLLDQTATLNVGAFWTDIKDYQTSVISSPGGGVVLSYLANADKVRVRGVEAEFNFRPTDRFSLYVEAIYNDATYRKFPNAPCPPELSGGTTALPGQPPSAPGTPGGISPASCDISGQLLPGVSKWSASYGFEYNIPTTLLGKEGQYYFGFDGMARTSFSSNPSRSAYMDVDGYSVENFRLGFRTGTGLNLFGWVRNAFDTNYYEVLSLGPSNTGLIAGEPADPRTYGLTLAYSY